MWPPYFQNRAVEGLIKRLQAVPEKDRRKLLETELPLFYRPDYLSVMLLDRYAKVDVVKDFQKGIREAIDCYFLGLNDAAVSTLLPILEGIVRGIAKTQGRNPDTKTALLSSEIQAMIDHEAKRWNNDSASDERKELLQGFKRFFDGDLYAHTSSYMGRGELNRHGVAHRLFQGFGSPANFCILVSILDHLTFVMSFRMSKMSVLAPDDTDESKALANYFLRLVLVRPAIASRFGVAI
jgi:hypothetical protein